jgi:hypothetical protein
MFKLEFESNEFAIYKKVSKIKSVCYLLLGLGPKHR